MASVGLCTVGPASRAIADELNHRLHEIEAGVFVKAAITELNVLNLEKEITPVEMVFIRRVVAVEIETIVLLSIGTFAPALRIGRETAEVAFIEVGIELGSIPEHIEFSLGHRNGANRINRFQWSGLDAGCPGGGAKQLAKSIGYIQSMAGTGHPQAQCAGRDNPAANHFPLLLFQATQPSHPVAKTESSHPAICLK